MLRNMTEIQAAWGGVLLCTGCERTVEPIGKGIKRCPYCECTAFEHPKARKQQDGSWEVSGRHRK